MTALAVEVDRMRQSPPRYSELPEGRWVDVGGLRTWVASAGTGTPVVMVYGGSFGGAGAASGAYAWAPTFHGLAEDHRVLVFDKPGQGFTDKPHRLEDYTMSAVVQHLLDLLDQARLGPVHLIGHSRGGYIATRATLLRPDLVSSLTIVNSGTLTSGVGTNEVVLGGPPMGPSRESVRWVYESYMHNTAAVTDEFVEQSWAVIQHPEYQAALRDIRENDLMANLFLPELAKDKRETLTWLAEGRLQRPTLVVWGRDDRTAHLSRGLGLFEQLASWERRTSLAVTDKCGHFPYREHPRWFVERVRRHLSEVDHHDY
ncbi:MAG: alpha/beta fold hydrolase [Nocardioidaceae bacterium]|nr:alpha/beta fold hydrolase [Nocardioidaceae bacterium]